MSIFYPIISSNLNAASYDESKQLLVVEFRSGAKYSYANFSATLWTQFWKTFEGKDGNSAGRFFQANIRHLPSEKVEDQK